ncbi:MAG: hypothetical protein HUU57_14870 [Bdellovibrio sp.]|nr:hypothetical protein [Bdellovibrio sp.]
MIRKSSRIRLLSTSLVAGALILSACQESSRQYSPRIAKQGAQASVTELLEKTNLSDEQQRQVMDPMGLPAYKEHLQKVFEAASVGSSLVPLSELFKVKKWILGAIDLKALERKAISKSRRADKNAPLMVVQTLHEVWIDSREFSKLDSKVAAEIILNEYLTSLYSLKHFSLSSLCKVVADNGLKAKCDANKVARDDSGLSTSEGDTLEALLAESHTTEKELSTRKEKNRLKNIEKENIARAKADTHAKFAKMVMTKDDIAQVDAVGAFVREQGRKLSNESLLKKMSEHKFDMRIFKMTIPEGVNTSPAKEDLANTVSGEALEALFTQAKALDQAKVSCALLTLDKSEECEVTVERFIEEAPEQEPRKFLKLSLKGKEEAQAFLTETVYQLKSIKFSYVKDDESGEELMALPLTGIGLKDRSEGAAFRLNFMVVNKTAETYQLAGFLSVPGVVSKVSQDSTTGKSKCEGEAVEAKAAVTDAVLVAKEIKNVQAVKKALGKIKLNPPCW